MSSYVSHTYYRQINQWIINKVEEFIKEKRIRRVEEGEKSRMTGLPLAFVIPRRVMIIDSTVANVEWQPVFDIIFVDDEADIPKGQQRMLRLGWDCYDKLMADRQMGGLGELYPRQIEPDYEKTPEYTRHWVLVRFEARTERSG